MYSQHTIYTLNAQQLRKPTTYQVGIEGHGALSYYEYLW